MGYWDLDAVLSRLPVPSKVDQAGLDVTAAMEAGMLPCMTRRHVTSRHGTVPLPIVVYIDGSFIKYRIAEKPRYITVRNLSSAVSDKSFTTGAENATCFELEAHCGTVECLARPAPTQISSFMHEICSRFYEYVLFC